jgi:hypothetical protein
VYIYSITENIVEYKRNGVHHIPRINEAEVITSVNSDGYRMWDDQRREGTLNPQQTFLINEEDFRLSKLQSV